MRIVLFVSLSINIFFTVWLISRKVKKSYFTVQTLNANNRQTIMQEIYDSLPIDTSDIVFVGNSITEQCPLEELLGPTVKNRGIGGNQTSHILTRIGKIARYQPKKIFLECGINDLIARIPQDSIIVHFDSIIRIIRSYSPKTMIHIESLLPCCWDYEYLNMPVMRLNAKLAELCQIRGVFYIDLFAGFNEANRLPTMDTNDGLHLNGNGYLIWARILKPWVYYD